MRVQVVPMALETLVEVVNGWGVEPRRAGARTGVPVLAEYFGEGAAAADAGPDRRTGIPTAVASALTDDGLVRFADTVFGVFAAEGTAGRVAAVSELLTGIDVRPDVVMDGHEVRRTWWTAAEDALLAAALLALRDQLADEDPGRLGICVDGGCADIYVDGSPAGRRRFCSVTCQNRARAAKYRRSHRTG
ncbi:CGNR zinc finger domain-containing protein [Kribbella sp. NPDC050470]|uniref:CGNR zinc finger domain-containing protein n=1 Tax=unclassified Kribbella TaxID=2644121 RepID=UPI003793FDB9